MIGRVPRSIVALTASLALAAPVASCARDARATAFLARADTALAQRRYPEVIQQSQRALAVDHDDAHASALLGRASFALGRYAQAYDALLRARARRPADRSVRLDLARYYMVEARLDDAREQARQIAAADSQSVDARILLGVTARTPRQLVSALHDLESVRATGSEDAERQIALGILYLRSRDTAAAGNAFRGAVSAAPQWPEAHAALASYYATVGQRGEEGAERAATERLLRGSVAAGRRELAQFFAGLGQRAEATRWLAGATPNDSSAIPAVRLLAELQLADGDTNASRTAASLLARDSTDVEALLQRGRARLAAHDAAGALADFDRALRAAPSLASAHAEYARAVLASSDSLATAGRAKAAVGRAASELQTAAKLAGGQYPDAILALAELQLRSGNARDAINPLDRFVRDNPGSIRGHELLAAVLSASGRQDEASEAFHRLIDVDPDRAESHYELGVALQTAGKKAEAAKEFETALTLSPAYADPMTQIVLMDLADGRSGAALDRLAQQLERARGSAPLYDLVGLAHAARNEQSLAESAFRRALDVDPTLLDARLRLAELYDATGRYDLAEVQSDSARRLDPRSLRALMALGIARQQRGDTARAREAYESALAIDPRFAGAANNLALLLLDQPGGVDRAYRLASAAKESAPDDPHVADTFGWTLYQRGDYARAMTILRQAAAKLPDSPAVFYHLGMTAQKMGDTTTARAALAKAVSNSADFQGKDEARRTLAQLK